MLGFFTLNAAKKIISAAVPALVILQEMMLPLAWAHDLPWLLSAAPLKLPQLGFTDLACARISCRAHMLLSSAA